MRHDSPVTANLAPSTLAGSGLAHYRLLLPLHHEASEAHSRGRRFYPARSRTLSSCGASTSPICATVRRLPGRDMTGWDSCRGATSECFVRTLREALEEFVAAHATWTLAR